MYENDFVEPQLWHRANKISINYDSLSRNGQRFRVRISLVAFLANIQAMVKVAEKQRSF